MIRPLTITDRELFLTLSREFFSSDAVSHPIPEEYHTLAFEHLMESDNYAHCFIIEAGGKPAGYALTAVTYSREAGGMAVWIEELYIRPEFRGAGLGTKLMEFLAANYKDAKRFRLELTNGNPAEHLYKREGFSPFPYKQMVREID